MEGSIILAINPITGSEYLLTDYIRALFGPLAVLYAAYYDYKRRYVPPKVWAFLIIFGLALLLYDLNETNILLLGTQAVLSLLVTVSISYLLYFMSLLGKGDVKLLTALAVFYPTYPLLESYPFAPLPYPLPLNIFMNSLLLNASLTAMLFIGINILRNLQKEKIPSFIPLLFGEQVPVEDFHNRHARLLYTQGKVSISGFSSGVARKYLAWCQDPDTPAPPITSLNQLNRDTLYLSEFLIDNDVYNFTKEEVEEDADRILWIASQEKVWVVHELPFVVPIFFGLCVSLIVGDPLLFVFYVFL